MTTITLTGQELAADARFPSNAAVPVTIAGADDGKGLRLFVVAPAGVVVAYADEFVNRSGVLQMNTTAMRDALASAAPGRHYMFAAVLADDEGNTLGSGFVRVVALPPVTVPVDIGEEVLDQIKGILKVEAESPEPDTQEELWNRHRQLAEDLAEVL